MDGEYRNYFWRLCKYDWIEGRKTPWRGHCSITDQFFLFLFANNKSVHHSLQLQTQHSYSASSQRFDPPFGCLLLPTITGLKLKSSFGFTDLISLDVHRTVCTRRCIYTDEQKQNSGFEQTRVSEVHKNNNQTWEISGFKVRVLLLTHIRSECFRIPRAPVTFTVSLTMTGTARPAGSNTQERKIKERSVVTLQMGGGHGARPVNLWQISEQWVCSHSSRKMTVFHKDNNLTALAVSLIHSVAVKAA